MSQSKYQFDKTKGTNKYKQKVFIKVKLFEIIKQLFNDLRGTYVNV